MGSDVYVCHGTFLVYNYINQYRQNLWYKSVLKLCIFSFQCIYLHCTPNEKYAIMYYFCSVLHVHRLIKHLQVDKHVHLLTWSVKRQELFNIGNIEMTEFLELQTMLRIILSLSKEACIKKFVTFRMPRVLFHKKSNQSPHFPSSPRSAISLSK